MDRSQAGKHASSVLFNFAFEHALKKIPVDAIGTLFLKSMQLVAYTDDNISRSDLSLIQKKTFVKLEKVEKAVG